MIRAGDEMYVRDKRPLVPESGRYGRLLTGKSPRLIAVLLLTAMSMIAWIKAGSPDLARPNLNFFLAVLPITVSASLLAGKRAGLATAVLTNILGVYLILPPQRSFAFASEAQVFFFTAVLVATVYAALLFGRRLRYGGE
jgi:K+-sensing histidine kinase KdpD